MKEIRRLKDEIKGDFMKLSTDDKRKVLDCLDIVLKYTDQIKKARAYKETHS